MNVLLVKPSSSVISILNERYGDDQITVYDSYTLEGALDVIRDVPLNLVLVFLDNDDPEISEIYNILAFSFEDLTVIGLLEEELPELSMNLVFDPAEAYQRPERRNKLTAQMIENE